MPDGRVVLVDQTAALARVGELVDLELWRADRRAAALEVVRALVCGMSWESGLIAGVTRAHAGTAASCSPRTVSRVVAWAIEVGLLVCVETGATAAFLGTETNRAPAYVVTVPIGWRPPGAPAGSAAASAVDAVGNPPAPCVGKKSPRRNRGKNQPRPTSSSSAWPVYDRATTPTERAAATATLLDRTGLSGRVVRWRAVALLGPWLKAGWSVAGLLHALDHHPDRQEVASARGDATRSARDPLAVLGYRLSPWRGRLDDVPLRLVAVEGAARRLRLAALAEGDPTPRTAREPVTPSAAHVSARAEIGRVLDRRRGRPRRSEVNQ